MHGCISAIEYFLPEKTVSTADLSAEFPDWSVEKIDSKTGIRDRHVVAADQCSSDLAAQSPDCSGLWQRLGRRLADFQGSSRGPVDRIPEARQR